MKNVLLKLYYRVELIPEAICLLLMSVVFEVVPRFYNHIQKQEIRIVAGCLVPIALLGGIGFILFRLIQRNKSEEKVVWTRIILLIIAAILVMGLVALQTAKTGLLAVISTNGIYPVNNRKMEVVPILNSLCFGITIQVIISALVGAYLPYKLFFKRLGLTLLYVGIPMAVLTYVFARFVPNIIGIDVIVTVFMWFTSISADEMIMGETYEKET